jgi:5-aminopentanamidase
MTTAGVLRVAAAQAESVSGDLTANVATAVRLVEQAAHNGARLVVLPELFLTGYDPHAWSRANCLTDLECPELKPLREATAHAGVITIASAALSEEGGPAPARSPAGAAATPGSAISLLLFDDRGDVRRVYDKQHPTDDEKPFFTPGRCGASLVVDGWELGLGICNDGCFPEHAGAAATDGATAYLCPSAYYAGSEHRRDLYYAARALDSGIYVVFADLTGRCGDFSFSGGSAVYDPEGRPVARLGQEPGIAYADLDPAEVERVRRMNPILRDRRDDLGARARIEVR